MKADWSGLIGSAILLTVYGAGFFVMLYPKIRRLRKNGACEVGVIKHDWRWMGSHGDNDEWDDWVCTQCRIQITLSRWEYSDNYAREYLERPLEEPKYMAERLRPEDIPLDFIPKKKPFGKDKTILELRRKLNAQQRGVK